MTSLSLSAFCKVGLGGMRSKSNGEESGFPFLHLGNEKEGNVGGGVAF